MSKNFEPNIIDYALSREKISAAVGLNTLVEAFHEGPLKPLFEASLPERSSNKSRGSYRLGLIQVASFLRGHDCLADLEKFRNDPLMLEIMDGETVAPRTMGDFLRDFNETNINNMNEFLSTQARSYRVQLEKMLKKPFKPSLAPRLDIDSTPHIQSGTKMEGLAYNYKEQWCLDSQIIFDELGFAWDVELRPGNTQSGDGAVNQIKRAFRSYKFNDEKYLSGDSAYCRQDVIKTCVGLGVTFTFTAHQARTGWQNHIDEITNWQPWNYSKEEKERAAKSGQELPQVEVGSFHWRPSWNETLCLPVVVKRTPTDQMDLFSGGFKHYGVVTNFSLFKNTPQQVIEHHNKRGNCENFIREGKYGYDLKHFPCQKLSANHAFGQLAFVAHNLLRWVAHHTNPQKPPYAKKIRDMFIHVPGKIVSHARQLVLRVPAWFLKEVETLRLALRFLPCSALGPSHGDTG